ncbi:hypothetical protein GSU68_15730 [Rathayibacter sp. VKM Ac-2759]|uniref:cell wall-binding repeat-containing protein n=1 Tax=Rathayibacter sp. VKM Ac-2759 TaxID=2609252 RepID=UPI001318575B|nr:cell wall-binding repeat-containing protein [Rathayibacter sp. VKM Ac-2759]QHC67874.1 hypothetical protein GSU68_15730 [Rathayibacter sp. VKM Ac-2759]
MNLRRITLGLCSIALGALLAAGITADPASAEVAPPGTISGTVTAPADVPGEHRYYIAAWDLGSTEFGFAQAAAGTELVLGRGETATYTLKEDPESGNYFGEGTWKVRVLASPVAGGTPEIGDEYWKDADRFSTATNATVPAGRGLTGVDFSPSAYAFTSTRIAGDDRYGTSVASTQVFAPGIPVLYIASGEKWADALSAGPAATHQYGALLLTDPDALPSAVALEIKRLAPVRTIVVGSDLTVSDAVYEEIDAIVGEITRVGGTDRYDTSRKVISGAYRFSSSHFYEVHLATGNNFPDALSIAGASARIGGPVLLVDGAEQGLDDKTRDILTQMHPYHAYVLGETPSISAGIEDDLVSSGLVDSAERIGGRDRYETSRLINEEWPAWQLEDTTYLATGEDFADALSGATAAAFEHSSVSLSRPDCVPAATVASLKSASIDTVKVLGSERTLSRTAGSITPC